MWSVFTIRAISASWGLDVGDPYRKVQPGDRLEFPALAWNAAIDAGRAFRAGQFDGGANGLTTTRSGVLISLINNSGSNLDRYGVLGLGDPLWTPYDNEDAFLRTVVFQGVQPAVPDHLGKFAIVLEPADDGRVARAWIGGCVTVRVDVLNDGHTYADVKDGSVSELRSAGYGSAQILWREGGTGSQWAVVRLGNETGACRVAYTTSSIGARSGSTLGYGTGTIQVINSTTRSASVTSIVGQELLNLFDKPINPGHYVVVVRIDSAWVIVSTDSCSAIATGLTLESFDFLMTTQPSSQPGTDGSDPDAGGADLVDPTDWVSFVDIEI